MREGFRGQLLLAIVTGAVAVGTACTPAGPPPTVDVAAPPDGPPPGQGRPGPEGEGAPVAIAAARVRVGAQATDPSAPGYDPDARPEEGPVREVDVAAFAIGATEVSVGTWRRCVDAGDCAQGDALGAGPLATSDDPGLPVAGITAAGAARLCAFLGGRLPTSAEWELAARGPEGRRFPWGDVVRCEPMSPAWKQRIQLEATRAIQACDALLAAPGTPPDVRAICADPMGHDPEHIVGPVRAAVGEPPLPVPDCDAQGPVPVVATERVDHPLRLQFLAGNVREWTSDEVPGGRVLRGGSFLSTSALELRAAAVTVVPADLQLPDAGVRCVLPAPR